MPTDTAAPIPKGIMSPHNDTPIADLAFFLKILKSASNPTKKRKRTKPMFATRVRFGIDTGGKIAAMKPGIRPMMEGPRTIPPMTSLMTWEPKEFEKGSMLVHDGGIDMGVCVCIELCKDRKVNGREGLDRHWTNTCELFVR